MSRISRMKYMRFTAVLAAVAIFMGSIDAGMIYVQAAPESIAYMEEGAENKEDVSALSGNDIEDGVTTDNPSEKDAVVEQTETDESDIMDEPAGKTRVQISGITIDSKVYDGKPVEPNTKSVALTVESTKEADSEDGNDVTDVLKDQLVYSYSGNKENGDPYPAGSETTDQAPKDAGLYRLIVTVSEENESYEGRKEYEFRIAKRKITIKPKDVDDVLVGGQLPDEYEYEILGDGFAEGESFDSIERAVKPTVTCEVEYPDISGEYPIIASGAYAGDNYDISYENGTLTVSEPEQEKAKLLKIIPLSPVTDVPNGTPLLEIGLPETIQIVIEDIAEQSGGLGEVTVDAAVEWSRVPINGTTYNASITTEQTFELGGTVVLPKNVELPEDAEDLSLNVTITVKVREAMESTQAVAAPTASIPSGSIVQWGTTVGLSCETEGATIYYTLDGSNPTPASNRYSAPIGIYGDRVIRAYAVKSGCPDSMVVKFSYYVYGTPGGNTGDNPGGNLGGDDEPEVPEEDIPSGGIPQGKLWTTEINGAIVYTGKAIKPEVRVYDSKTRLEENKDYSITYKNNINAADASDPDAPSVVITFKGNYEGQLIRTFTIKPKSLSDPDVSIDDVAVAYNGKAQKPSPTVTWNGKKLIINKDYTVPDVSYTDVNADNIPRTITVTGCGNYTGERNFDFIITNGVPASKLTVSKIPDQTYTGTGITPRLTVKYKGVELALNQNYSVEYVNNIEVGTATAIITGMGRYAGTKKVTFKIKAIASLKKAKINVQFDNVPIYTGQPIQADRVIVTLELKENGQSVTRTLAEGTDYETAYQKNDKAGTASIIFTGKGAYDGKVTKTFKITACDIQSDRIKVDLKSGSYSYVKGGCKPEPTVSFKNEKQAYVKLTLSKDYTLSYKKNNAAGNTATVIIKGKGNFKGSVTKTFDITSCNIGDGDVKVSAADRIYKNKKNIYKTTVHLTDTSGKVLKAGTDYDKKFVYTYQSNTSLENGVDRAAGEAVDKTDIIPAGTIINITITAKGSNYTGTVTGTYRIAGKSISSAKVTIPEQRYTGKEITLSVDQIQVKMDGNIISTKDYEIVGYSNNIKKGTAKVTIHGLNGYGGTKTVSFKIKGKEP